MFEFDVDTMPDNWFRAGKAARLRIGWLYISGDTSDDGWGAIAWSLPWVSVAITFGGGWFHA